MKTALHHFENLQSTENYSFNGRLIKIIIATGVLIASANESPLYEDLFFTVLTRTARPQMKANLISFLTPTLNFSDENEYSNNNNNNNNLAISLTTTVE